MNLTNLPVAWIDIGERAQVPDLWPSQDAYGLVDHRTSADAVPGCRDGFALPRGQSFFRMLPVPDKKPVQSRFADRDTLSIERVAQLEQGSVAVLGEPALIASPWVSVFREFRSPPRGPNRTSPWRSCKFRQR